MKKLFIILTFSLALSNCTLLISDDIVTPNGGKYPPPYQVGSKVWIENRAFEMLYDEIDDAFDDEDKLYVLKKFNINFNVEQGYKILCKFNEDEYRLRALEYILPRLLKTNEDVFRLTKAFFFTSERNHAGKMISRYFNAKSNNYCDRNKPYQKEYFNRREYVMNEADFDEFLQSFRKQVFKSEKFTFLKYASQRSVFSVDQCIRIMKEFTFDDEKLKVCEMIVPKIVCGNVYKLFEQFTFISSKDKLKEILEMSDDEYRRYR